MANRTLFELFHKESISSTDIIPIQIDSIDGVLNKITIGQLINFIHKDNIHILDITLTDAEQKLEIASMYSDHIAGKNFNVYIANNITIDSIICKSYILGELIFSDVDAQTYKVYIKYNTIVDDNNSIVKKENSITATIAKTTGFVSENIIYTTKDYETYKNTHIDDLLNGKVDNSQVLTDVPANAIFTDTIYIHPNHTGDVTSTGDGATSISENVVTNAKLADMVVNTIKGRKTASTGDPEDITIEDLKIMLALNNVTNETQIAASLKGATNGVAELDAGGKVPSTQLPSYVDDVREYDDITAFPPIGDTSVIYVALDTNKTYRWSGSSYTIISDTIALGETSSTAYRGDRGKTAYDHSQLNHAPAGATINDTDANLRDRSTHTGTQVSSTISDFASTVRDTILTGLSLVTNATITVTDSVLSALGKLQKQVTDNLSTLTSHTGNTSNPHSVTKTQVGLSNVDNTADSTKNVLSATKLTTSRTITLGGDLTGSVSIDGSENVTLTATVVDDSHAHVISNVDGLQNALDGKVDDNQVLTNVPVGAVFTDTVTTINNKTGAIAKSDIVALGIPAQDTVYVHPNHSGDVTSTGDGTTSIAANIVTNTKLADMVTNTIKGRKTASTGDPEDITISDLKTMLALNNVTNVAQLAASLKGAVNGVAELDSNGKVPSTQLPSYVDDVLEYADFASLPVTGETSKIYITLDTNKTYRWGGSAYIVISETLALGETSSTAYRGDRGKTAYDHSQQAHAPAGATINATDASLRDRSTHTGTQASSTISDFTSTVRSTVLTGLSLVTNAAVTAADSVLVAIGKLQKQITDDIASLSSHTGNTSNPHSVTKTQVGLGSADNTADSVKNVLSATKLTTARTITLGGDLTGSVSIDGSTNVTLTATVVDDSHAHIIDNVDGLQTALNGKVDDGQVLTDVPTNAIFTDTVTTINGKTGAIAKSDIVALGIPAQDTVYSHPSTHSADMIVDGTNNKAYTAAEKTKLGNISGSNTGDETATTIGTLINGAGEKETPIDADMVGLMDSEASNVIKKLSWSNIKATLKTYFDTLYALTSHSHAIDDIEELSSTLEGFMAGSKFTITIGDNVHSVYTINHNLATEDVLVSVIKLETKENTLTAFTIVDTNNITIDFGVVIGVDTYKVIVL